MKLTKVSYSRTIQAEPYSPETLTLEAEVGKESASEVFEALRDTVHALLEEPLPDKYDPEGIGDMIRGGE